MKNVVSYCCKCCRYKGKSGRWEKNVKRNSVTYYTDNPLNSELCPICTNTQKEVKYERQDYNM